MKDHTRRVPRSTRSCRTPLSPSGIPPGRLRRESKNPYKTRTKCNHFHRCEFFSCSVSEAYNLNPLKCTDVRTTISPLLFENQSLPAESHDIGLDGRFACYPFSLGEKVRMR